VRDVTGRGKLRLERESARAHYRRLIQGEWSPMPIQPQVPEPKTSSQLHISTFALCLCTSSSGFRSYFCHEV